MHGHRHRVEQEYRRLYDDIGLGQRHEFIPGELPGMFDEAGKVQRPLVFRDVGLDAEIEDGPIFDFVLAGGKASRSRARKGAPTWRC